MSISIVEREKRKQESREQVRIRERTKLHEKMKEAVENGEQETLI